MIKILHNYITKPQCDSIINLWHGDTDVINVNDGVYHFYGFNLIPHMESVIDIIPEFQQCDFKKFRIQYTDETITQVPTTHVHINRYSFVIFLNDEFEGGELVFNEMRIKPTIGTMVYFTGDEPHRVENAIGKRYTLVGFLNNAIFQTPKKML